MTSSTCSASPTKAAQAPGLLSGGHRQRLAIARALANEPTLLLADEPTGSLDSVGGAEAMELFRRLHQDGRSILLVTHDDEVAAAADRTVEMRDGGVHSEDRVPMGDLDAGSLFGPSLSAPSSDRP